MNTHNKDQQPVRKFKSSPQSHKGILDMGLRKRTFPFLITYLALASPRSCSSFAQVAVHGKRKRSFSTRRYFRELGELPFINDQHIDLHQESIPSTDHPMPVWLQQEHGENAEELLADLENILMERYLSQNEATQISTAILNAADGDWRKISGATKLCRILVETMDMGVDTVIAAAHHYCSCFESRERNAVLNQFSSNAPRTNFLSLWDSENQYNVRADMLNPESAKIAHATALLKRTEMIASSLVQGTDFENLRVLLLSETRDWRALAIRSAAALYRLRGVIDAYESSFNTTLGPEEMRVAREALHIYAPLVSRLGMHRLKNELERAAFRILYRRQYEAVTKISHQARSQYSDETISEGMERVLTEVKERIIHELECDPALNRYTENIVVSARIKQPYSLWRKMLKIGAKSILDVPDALALRIVFDAKKNNADEDDEITKAAEKALCHYVQELCMKNWKPNKENPRFKDYIERPKKNGYQSLHYSANTNCFGDNWNFEIQIRSGEMHQVAEYGLASHWDYKLEHERNGNEFDSKSKYQLDPTSEAYLKSVQEWHWQQLRQNSPKVSNFETMKNPIFLDLDNEKDRIRAERERQNAERLAPYIEAFSSAQSSVTRNQVLVFLSPTDDSYSFDSKIISLPSGSCVMDALREGEKLFGIMTNFHGIGVVQNDQETILTQRLANGDVLKIPALNAESMLTM